MKKYFTKTAELVLLFFLLAPVYGQEEHRDTHDEHHHHKNNEINAAIGFAYVSGEGEYAPGFHIHYTRGIGCKHRLALGVGFESIIDEHKHNTISIIGEYRIWNGLKLAYAPGFILPTSEHNELQFNNHAELVYEFEIGGIHFGPVIGFGISKEHWHLMPAVHIGTTF